MLCFFLFLCSVLSVYSPRHSFSSLSLGLPSSHPDSLFLSRRCQSVCSLNALFALSIVFGYACLLRHPRCSVSIVVSVFSLSVSLFAVVDLCSSLHWKRPFLDLCSLRTPSFLWSADSLELEVRTTLCSSHLHHSICLNLAALLAPCVAFWL